MIRGKNGGVVYLEQLKSSVESDVTEKATSRKCEGQLSSTKTNSCSSYKGANRTIEMAQEDNNPCWDNLPSVILQEIFSYLPHNSRLKASQVCRNWRHTLFHPRFWKKITFCLKDEESISWARLLQDGFGLSVHEATIRCGTQNHSVELLTLLEKLSDNKQLRKLFLESSSSSFECSNWIGKENQGNYSPLIKYILKIIETSNRLEALSLGCIMELIEYGVIILEHLHLHNAKHLQTLSLATVRYDSNVTYDFYDLEYDYASYFSSFIRLTILTIDYEFVSNSLLKALNNGTMERLVIHVHSWNEDPVGTSDSAWQSFVQKNPKCELRLTLLHTDIVIDKMNTHILRPSMPLSHLKVLFCEDVNIRALHCLSNWYSLTLKSLVWIDSLDFNKIPATFNFSDPNSPDPLVLIAWKCTKLVEIVFIGHTYYEENLLAIARLRGSSLKSLVFAEKDIIPENESWHKAKSITHEIQEIMGHKWEPVSDADLPEVVKHSYGADTSEVIMPWVLPDQK